ncbi:hypothetical protein C8J56DRAFT_1166742 [Mycena floridula]|nr:hypothetical protein C8J56DRAFT_1166742 [Mycena floridula]
MAPFDFFPNPIPTSLNRRQVKRFFTRPVDILHLLHAKNIPPFPIPSRPDDFPDDPKTYRFLDLSLRVYPSSVSCSKYRNLRLLFVNAVVTIERLRGYRICDSPGLVLHLHKYDIPVYPRQCLSSPCGVPFLAYTDFKQRWEMIQDRPAVLWEGMARQVDDSLHPYDLATLLAIVQRQRNRGVPASDMGTYSAYIVYPSACMKQLVFIGAQVPLATIHGLETHAPMLKRILFCQTRVDIHIQPWQDSSFLAVLSQLIEYGMSLEDLVQMFIGIR